VALGAAQGTVGWRFSPDEASDVTLADPVVDGDTVYVPGTVGGEGTLIAIDAEDGTELWRITTGGVVTAQPSVVDDSVVVVDEAGAVMAFASEDGHELWSTEAGQAESLPPVVVDGVVLVAAREGLLTALKG
jgi:outer membrane protein assembly factor BamB